MNTRSLTILSAIALAPITAASCAVIPADNTDETGDEILGVTPVLDILADVPPGTAWKDVKPSIRRKLKANAEAFYAKVRHDWGALGLDEKEQRLLYAPTAAMIENFDRVMKFDLSAIVPDTFVASRDVSNPELLVQLKRAYLIYAAKARHNMMSANPEYKDWDGGDHIEFNIRDPQMDAEQKAYAADVYEKLAAIPTAELSELEQAIVHKMLFNTRAMKSSVTHAGEEATVLYDLAIRYQSTPESHVFSDDNAFLLALNAQMFKPLNFLNVGTVDTFNWDFEANIDPYFLSYVGLEPESVAGEGFLTLAGWWQERVNGLPAANKKCTIYTASDRKALWDTFTASQLSNADGSETLESYGASYAATAARRLEDMKALATRTVNAAFPNTSVLSAAQKAQVLAAIQAETRPAAIIETIYSSLDTATGSTTASTALKAQFDGLTYIGGYEPGEALRQADVDTVNAMWANVRAWFAAHYSGRTVDIAALLPTTLTITPSEGTHVGPTGVLTVGLGLPYQKATLYSTMLHEAKHVIDFNSRLPVQGAAWEGAALMVEETLGPAFLEEVMASEATKLPFYRLQTEVDNVRLTATTDATLKVLLRDSSCSGSSKPNSIEYAKSIVRSYGYTDDETLQLRSRRAHLGYQYLEYEYGRVLYIDLIAWLQQQLGTDAVTVDPILLQACAMPSPAKDQAAVTKLRTCVGL